MKTIQKHKLVDRLISEAQARGVEWAFAVAVKELSHPVRFTPEEAAEWKEAERILIARQYCPHCACDGFRVKLMAWQRSTPDTYAGRECPSCESFVVCGQQDYFGPTPQYDTDASGMCFSDADPGL